MYFPRPSWQDKAVPPFLQKLGNTYKGLFEYVPVKFVFPAEDRHLSKPGRPVVFPMSALKEKGECNISENGLTSGLLTSITTPGSKS